MNSAALASSTAARSRASVVVAHAVEDVLAHRALEEEGLLADDRDPAAVAGQVDGGHVHAVEQQTRPGWGR